MKKIKDIFNQLSKKQFKKLGIALLLMADLIMLWQIPLILSEKLSSPSIIRLFFTSTNISAKFASDNFQNDIRIIFLSTFIISMIGILLLNILSYLLYFKEQKLAIIYIKALNIFGGLLSALLFIEAIISGPLIQLLFILTTAIYLFNYFGIIHFKISYTKKEE